MNDILGSEAKSAFDSGISCQILMMKRLLYILSLHMLLISQNAAFAQPKFSDTALYKITYKFIFAYDTTDFGKKSSENVNLYIGQAYSVYRDAEYELYEQEKLKEMQQLKYQIETRDLSKPITRSGSLTKIPKSEVFKKIDANVLYKKEVLAGRDYVIEDNLPQIQWKIDSETKMFGNIKGQKAQGYFRGRVYIAWFAPLLKLRAGPWKLSGLPGVILEAYDEKNEVLFSFTGLEFLQKKGPTIIALPARYIKTKNQDYEKLVKLYREDPIAFINNRRAQQGITVSVEGKSLDDIIRNQPPKKKPEKSPINNLLETVRD